jgi:hypothetical protein
MWECTIQAVHNRIWSDVVPGTAEHHAQAVVIVDFCAAILRIHREANDRGEKGLEGLRQLEAAAMRVLNAPESD